MRVASLIMTVALTTVVVASLASQDKSFRVPYSNAPPPHVGNGFVAAFLNNSNEYVAGVFSGSTVKSTRAALPATNTRYLASIPGGAPPQWWLHESTGTGRLALFDANSNYVGEQVWLAARAPLAMADAPSWNLLGSTISFVVVAPDAGNVSLSWIVPTPDMSDYPLVDLVYHNTSVDRPDVHIAVYQTTIPEEAAPISSTILIATVWRVPSATTVASQDWASSAIISSRCTEFVVAGFLDQQIQTVIECARHRYDAIDANVDTAILQHLTAWSEMWDGSMTTTNSNASSVLDRVITSSMYALYSSLHHLAPFSTSPGGLPTDGYNGHTFWDMETWMMPNLVLLEPELTKGSPIRYRLDRLEGASVNAVSVVNGTTGYAFPWESAFTGYDVCPWPQGEHSEIHITADVVNGWKLYYDATHDDDFLSSAFVALVNTSRFWLSRAVVDSAGVYHINDVTPPDEYHYGNDSAYTNSAVKIAVEFTLRAADILNKTIPEAPFLSALAAGLFVPYNATGNYHPEFTGYEGDKVKQADVVLMNYPLGVTMDPSTARNDLLYYAPRTDPRGPAMTWSVFSIGYMGLKDQVNADKYFREGYNLNTVPPYYQWYEVPGAVGCPNFLTGAGGFLQSVWAGIGGLRVRAETLRITEAHMLGVDGVQSLTLHRIYYRGVPLKLEYALKDNTTTYVGITRLPAEDGSRKMPTSIRGFTGVELLHFDVPQHRRVGSPHVALYANGRALVEDHVVVFNLNTETQVDIGTTASPHQQ